MCKFHVAGIRFDDPREDQNRKGKEKYEPVHLLDEMLFEKAPSLDYVSKGDDQEYGYYRLNDSHDVGS